MYKNQKMAESNTFTPSVIRLLGKLSFKVLCKHKRQAKCLAF